MRVVILLLLLFLSTGTQEASMNHRDIVYDVKEVIQIDTTTNEGRVLKVLADSGFSVNMMQIFLAQAKLESGEFKNRLTRNWNNVYSMLHSKFDPYSKGNWGYAEGRSGYAVYGSIEESVYARLWYSRKWKYPMHSVTVAQYVHHIKKKRYFTCSEKEYLNGMMGMINKDAYIFKNKSVIIACR